MAAQDTTRMQPATPTTIALFGLFGCGNSGNDGSLEAMLDFLRRVRPDAKLVCICPTPETVTARFGLPGISINRPRSSRPRARLLNRLLLTLPQRVRNWTHAFRQAGRFDVLIVPGTGALDDYGTGPASVPLDLFGWCLAAKLQRARVGFVSVGAGPIHHRLSRWLMRTAAASADYRSYRDTVSRQFMESIGLKRGEDRIYPDIAFSLATPPPIPAARQDEPMTVGLGVMAYCGWADDPERGAAIYEGYLEKLCRFVHWLVDRGYRVRLLTGDKRDERAVGDLLRKLAASPRPIPPGRVIAEPTDSLHELMAQIAGTAIIVATRFHNIVCALKLAKPTISLGYADKNDVLMADMGLSGYCQHVEHFELDMLTRQFDVLLRDRVQIRDKLMIANRAFRDRLAQQDADILSILLQGNSKP